MKVGSVIFQSKCSISGFKSSGCYIQDYDIQRPYISHSGTDEKIGTVFSIYASPIYKLLSPNMSHDFVVRHIIPIPVTCYSKKWASKVKTYEGIVYRGVIYASTDIPHLIDKSTFTEIMVAHFFSNTHRFLWTSDRVDREQHIGKYFTEEDERESIKEFLEQEKRRKE